MTVITPCYNHGPYLPDYFEGLLAQSYRDVELIFHDDGSTDNSWQVAKSYEERLRKHFRRVVMETGPNVGFLGVLERAVALVTGAYVCILESDDYYLPGKLEKTVGLLLADPELGAVHGETTFLYPDRVEERHWRAVGRSIPVGDVFRELLVGDNFIMTCSFCARADLFLEHVDFSEYRRREYRMADYPAFLDVAAHAHIGYLDEPLSVYRVLPESASRSEDPLKTALFSESYLRIKIDYLRDYGLEPDVLRQTELHYRRVWLDHSVRMRAELAAQVAQLEARLREAQAANGEVRAELAAQSAQSQAELAVVRAELAATAAQLADMYASTSWRVSAPVRLAGRQAGELSRRVRHSRVRREAGRLARSWAPGVMERRDRRLAALQPPSVRPSGGRPDGPGDDPLLLAAAARKLEYRPLVSILVPVYDTEPQYLRLAVDSVLAQAYPEWELILCDDGSTKTETRAALGEIAELDPRIRVHSLDVNSGIAAATNAALALAQGEFVAMLDHDDELLPAALLAVIQALNADPTLDVVYTDQDYVEADGSVAQTFYKPDWSLELFRGVMYVGHLLVVRRALADEIGGFDPAFNNVQDFEFMLRLTEHTERIAHVPTILYHWRKIPGSVAFGGNEKKDIEPLQAAAVNAHFGRCGVAAVARSNPQHAHRLLIAPAPRREHPPVSVVVRAAGAEAHLEACVASILAAGSYPRREIIVSGGDIPGELAQRLEALGAVLVAPGESGGAAALAGVQAAGGDLIVSMVGDLEVQTPDWLEHLLYECELPGVACVAPLILAADGTVACAGLILGGADVVGPAMQGRQPGTDGYAGSLSCVREVSAVPGDCFALARPLVALLGPLSPYYAGDGLQAIDFSLRASSKGLRNLCTPRVVVRRRGPALGDGQRDGQRDGRRDAPDALDALLLADAWGPLLAKGDPFHNRNFAPGAPGYEA